MHPYLPILIHPYLPKIIHLYLPVTTTTKYTFRGSITQPVYSFARYFSAILADSPIWFTTILLVGFGWAGIAPTENLMPVSVLIL
jgi:hypothetical protein